MSGFKHLRASIEMLWPFLLRSAQEILIHNFLNREIETTLHPLYRVANIPLGANEITHVTTGPARGLCGHANNAVTPDTKLGHCSAVFQ